MKRMNKFHSWVSGKYSNSLFETASQLNKVGFSLPKLTGNNFRYKITDVQNPVFFPPHLKVEAAFFSPQENY